MTIRKWTTTVWTVYHPPLTCDSHMFIQILPHHAWSLYISHLYKKQQSRCFCQWTTMLNVWLQIVRTCYQKYKQNERRLWQACTNIFCECVGVHMYKSECIKIDNSLLHICLNILLFSGSKAVSDKSIKSCIWGHFKKSTSLYTCTLWKIYMFMNINIIQMNTIGGPYQCALKSLEE